MSVMPVFKFSILYKQTYSWWHSVYNRHFLFEFGNLLQLLNFLCKKLIFGMLLVHILNILILRL